MKNKAANTLISDGGMKISTLSPQFHTNKAGTSEKIKKICATTDELTWQNIRNLCTDLRMNKLQMLTHLIEVTYKSETHRREMVKFHNEFWLRREESLSGEISQNRINLLESHVEMLRTMAWETLRTGNRSEFIRILVAFWAWKRNLLKFTV